LPAISPRLGGRPAGIVFIRHDFFGCACKKQKDRPKADLPTINFRSQDGARATEPSASPIHWSCKLFSNRGSTPMRTLLVVFLTSMIASTAIAQVNMQYNGQYSGQYSGQANGRVDGRGSKNEGLPPSAADKGGITENVSPTDCAELQTLNPNVRPRMQDRIGRACDYQYPP
jgi:hypothetical protein